jgi:hypothetical protein
MKSEELIYARVKLSNLPNRKRLYLSKNCKEIYYVNNKEKVYIYKNDKFEMKHEYDFLKTKLVSEGTNGWYKILLNVDVEKINTIVRQPYNLNGRRHLFDIFKQCYIEMTNNYVSHVILNLYENMLMKRDDYNSFIEWFIKKEMNNNIYSYNGNNIYKVGTFYVDLLKGQFLKDLKLLTCNLNGGIIYDTTLFWIENIINSIKSSDIKVFDNNSFVNTKCTLIICEKMLCPLWVNKLKSLECRISYKLIQTSKDHKSFQYKDILELDYLIISGDYLMNKKYLSLFDDYNINNISLKEILEIIKNEFGEFENIKCKTDVMFSIFNWSRIIIDSTSFYTSMRDPLNFELLMTFNSNIKWIHLAKMPIVNIEYINIFKYLLNTIDVSFPLYSESKIIYIDDLLYVFNTKSNNNTVINEQIITIKSGKLEQHVNKYISNLKGISIDQFYDNINNLYENIITRQMYVNMMEKINKQVEFDNLFCPICYSKSNQDDVLFTECGHYYCIECVLTHLNYNNTCPLCRSELTIKKLHYVDDDCKNDKANELIKVMMNMKDRIYIYVNTLKCKKYLSNYLRNYGLYDNIIWLSSETLSTNILLDSEKYKSINILFYDICTNIEEIRSELKKLHFFNVNIYYFFYDIMQNKVKNK